MKARIVGGEFDGVEFEVSKTTAENLQEQIKWKHGDIALSSWCLTLQALRLILIRGGDIEIWNNSGALLYGGYSQDYIKKHMKEYGYKRIGNLFKDSDLVIKTLKGN